LEKAGDVLVTRTAKDGQLRMVFWNDLKASEEKGGMMVEKGESVCSMRLTFTD
jgi:transcription initiation factor TFIIE subunit beta